MTSGEMASGDGVAGMCGSASACTGDGNAPADRWVARTIASDLRSITIGEGGDDDACAHAWMGRGATPRAGRGEAGTAPALTCTGTTFRPHPGHCAAMQRYAIQNCAKFKKPVRQVNSVAGVEGRRVGKVRRGSSSYCTRLGRLHAFGPPPCMLSSLLHPPPPH